MKSLSYRNVKWLSCVCEVPNNGERDGDSRGEREGCSEMDWLSTRFGETGSCRWLGQVRLSFGWLSRMQSIPFVSASQAERWCTSLAVSFDRPIAISFAGHRWPGSLPLTSDWLAVMSEGRPKVFLASHFCFKRPYCDVFLRVYSNWKALCTILKI